jgi:hypothetical protein
MKAETIENGRNAGSRTLTIMGKGRADSIPLRAGTGLKMLFKIVGMNINQPRDQKVAS